MTLNDYQKRAMETCMPSCNNFSYMMLNLVGEIGELASKVAKGIRREKLAIGFSEQENEAEENELIPLMTFVEWTSNQDELMKEAGDILWHLSGLCSVMGWNLNTIAQMNLDKLASRKARGMIDGNGDNR